MPPIERRRGRRATTVVFLLALAMAAALALTRSQWLVKVATQYVEERRQDERPLLVAKLGDWKLLQAGLEYRKVRLRREGGWFTGFNLIALRVDPALVNLRMIQIPSRLLPAQDMVTIAEHTGALALMNASYFESDMKVMGLLIVDGEQRAPLRRGGSVHHGAFLLRGKKAYLQHRTNVSLEGVDQAFQAGPWLVTDGLARENFRNVHIITRRSAFGVDAKGRVVLAATDAFLGGLALPEMANLLAAKEPEGFGLWRAINCDGGSSTQLLLRHPRKNVTIRSSVHVPVYIAAFGRDG